MKKSDCVEGLILLFDSLDLKKPSPPTKKTLTADVQNSSPKNVDPVNVWGFPSLMQALRKLSF